MRKPVCEICGNTSLLQTSYVSLEKQDSMTHETKAVTVSGKKIVLELVGNEQKNYCAIHYVAEESDEVLENDLMRINEGKKLYGSDEATKQVLLEIKRKKNRLAKSWGDLYRKYGISL